MSSIWDLKKIDFPSKLNLKKPFKIRNARTLYLNKSYSFNNIKSGKTPSDNYPNKKISNNNSIDNMRKNEKKLKDKNTQLKIKLNNINKELIFAKSSGNKKIFQLQKNNKLLITAINIKKLTLDLEPNNIRSSSYDYNKKTEEEITLKGFQSNLIHKIKKQYYEIENDNKNKNKIITELKNNINNFNSKELSNKNKELIDQYIALKYKYDSNSKKNNEYKLKIKDYIELENILNKKNFCILELRESLKDIENSNTNLDKDIDKLKNKLKKLETENENLNNEYYLLNQKFIQASRDKNEMENKITRLIDENNEKIENNN